MPLFTLPLLLLLAALSTPLHAQDGAAGEGAPFCGLSGEELLASLEGTWSLTQGGGGILYPVPMPLPAQDPTSIRFTYNADEGIIDAQASDLSDGMILFPADGPELEVAEDYIAVGEEGAATSGCAWSATPILIGTNLYTSLGSDYVS